MYSDLIDHGCWCGKINTTSDKSILGGPQPQDDLDAICKQWYSCRHCNDHINGGSCYQAENLNLISYDIEYSSEINGLECIISSDSCGNDSCAIDLYYSNLIADYLESEGLQLIKVTDASVCHPNVANRGSVAIQSAASSTTTSGTSNSSSSTGTELTCQGTAPYLEIVKDAVSSSNSEALEAPQLISGIVDLGTGVSADFRMTFRMKLLHTQPSPSEIVRIRPVGATESYKVHPALGFTSDNFKLSFSASRCGALSVKDKYNGATTDIIGNVGDIVEVGLEVYNGEPRLKVGETVTELSTGVFDHTCTDPDLPIEALFLSDQFSSYGAGVEIYDFSYQRFITEHKFEVPIGTQFQGALSLGVGISYNWRMNFKLQLVKTQPIMSEILRIQPVGNTDSVYAFPALQFLPDTFTLAYYQSACFGLASTKPTPSPIGNAGDVIDFTIELLNNILRVRVNDMIVEDNSLDFWNLFGCQHEHMAIEVLFTKGTSYDSDVEAAGVNIYDFTYENGITTSIF